VVLPHYIVCVPGLPDNLNSVGQVLHEFCTFGEILAIQENHAKGYALIEFADLYAAYKVVNSKRRFFSNEFARPFFAVAIDRGELEAVRQEHTRRKEVAVTPAPRSSGGEEIELLTEMMHTHQRKWQELQTCQNETAREILQDEITTLKQMMDILSQ
jgi:hypothetical protein